MEYEHNHDHELDVDIHEEDRMLAVLPYPKHLSVDKGGVAQGCV
jgi:hypothetical protein